jgi:hypothetical protein
VLFLTLFICFGISEDGIIGYGDSGYACDLDRKMSLSSYVFTVEVVI